MVKIKIKVVDFKTSLLYFSAFFTLCFMIMCLISAWFNMASLKEKIGQKLNNFKAVKVDSYTSPGILFLANGVYTYECITNEFRFDPRPVDSDFDFEGKDPEDPRLRIQDSCVENSTEFAISLSDLSNYAHIIEEFPDWLQKNLVSTTDLSACNSGGDSRKRKRRDYTDDLKRCDGQCSKIWQCANEPEVCVLDRTFDVCFSSSHLLAKSEPCTTYRACIGDTPVLEATCETWIRCMHPARIDEVECLTVWDCFLHGGRKPGTPCYDVFQCLEDQVQDKCQLLTTPAPVDLSEAELAVACEGATSTISEQPGLDKLDNSPLKLILVKGPSTYINRDYIFASLRPANTETGVWASLHPNFEEVEKQFLDRENKIPFLGELIKNYRWTFLAREFLTFNFMTQTQYKIEGKVDSVSIRQELTTSMLNKSDPTQSDYRPVEVYYSWKDGYVIEGNTFVAVTIWDAFSVIAATLLMLERAWLTWGRLMNKLVEANAKRVMKQYEVGSPEWLLFQKLMSEGGNLVESMMTLRRLKEEEKRQARLAYRRALEQKRRRQKDEKFKMKLERMKAIKYGIVSDEILDWDEKRRTEWMIYKKMVKQDYQDNQKFYDELSKREQEDFEREEQERLEREKKMYREMKRLRKGTAATSKTGATSDGGSSSSEELNFDNAELHGKLMTNKELQEQLKQKRTKKMNIGFTMPDQEEEVEITTGVRPVLDHKPWAKKKDNSSRQSGQSQAKNPSDWISSAFDS